MRSWITHCAFPRASRSQDADEPKSRQAQCESWKRSLHDNDVVLFQFLSFHAPDFIGEGLKYILFPFPFFCRVAVLCRDELISLNFSPRSDEPTFSKEFDKEERLKQIAKNPVMSVSMMLAEGIKISQTLTQI